MAFVWPAYSVISSLNPLTIPSTLSSSVSPWIGSSLLSLDSSILTYTWNSSLLNSFLSTWASTLPYVSLVSPGASLLTGSFSFLSSSAAALSLLGASLLYSTLPSIYIGAASL